MPKHRRKLKRNSSRRTRRHSPGLELSPAARRQIAGTFQIALGILVMLSLLNRAGSAGDAVNTVLVFFFGKWGFIFPAVLLIAGALHWFTSEDVALGRPYRTLGEDGVRRYDRGIGFRPTLRTQAPKSVMAHAG